MRSESVQRASVHLHCEFIYFYFIYLMKQLCNKQTKKEVEMFQNHSQIKRKRVPVCSETDSMHVQRPIE